jgi:hypothetical protein
MIEESETYTEFQQTLERHPELAGEKESLFGQVKERMLSETEYSIDQSGESIWKRARDLLQGGTGFHLEFVGSEPELSEAVSRVLSFVRQHPFVQCDPVETKPPSGDRTTLKGTITGRNVNLVMFTGAIREIDDRYSQLELMLHFSPQA